VIDRDLSLSQLSGQRKKFMHRRIKTAIVLLAFATVFALGLTTNAALGQDSDSYSLRAKLISFNQVPSVLASSKGHFEGEINSDGTLSFSLTYSNMSSAVVQAHIHFGAGRTNGGVIVFLCGGPKAM
jgi:hypothetical protein